MKSLQGFKYESILSLSISSSTQTIENKHVSVSLQEPSKQEEQEEKYILNLLTEDDI